MFLSRQLDDRQRALKRQQKTFFQLSCAGHEALLAAAGLVLTPGIDWVYPYYRDQALCLTLGMTTADVLLEAAGSGTAPFSGGRQMPNHWGSRRLHIASRSSATGMHFLHAVGCAEATTYLTGGTREWRPATAWSTTRRRSRVCCPAKGRQARVSSGKRSAQRQPASCRCCS